MQHVPQHLAKLYRTLKRHQRRHQYLLSELILHPDTDLASKETMAEILKQRKIRAKLTEHIARTEELLWRNYGNGHELVKQQRKLNKGEVNEDKRVSGNYSRHRS